MASCSGYIAACMYTVEVRPLASFDQFLVSGLEEGLVAMQSQYRIRHGCISWRTDFSLSPGHIILEADSISCPIGQNFLGKCVPPDTLAWRTDFPPTPVTPVLATVLRE